MVASILLQNHTPCHDRWLGANVTRPPHNPSFGPTNDPMDHRFNVNTVPLTSSDITNSRTYRSFSLVI